ncbi:ABC transporter substrate-binding protein [Niallia nealsonii]|uniref:Sugar ABC transporter substrate-binding protein n=1 Tax=Niallia nealsonii TaxID=115979 RepID=A0A2N0Z6W4_9BACI|nr:ABC transporter substrate-binding protein [Niallia nealsonii]PKG25265.1 sugar ABC transporter substrate-binding protein [Niallia nealsonii]
MIRLRIVLFMFLNVIILFLLTSCKETSSSPKLLQQEQNDRLKVGFSQAENNNPWRIAETNSIKKEAREKNADLIYFDAQGSSEKQLKDVKQILESNVDYLILAPRQYDELAPALQMAKEKNVPVILIDREAKGKPGEDYLTFIAADYIWEGEQAAKWLVHKTNGKANIVEISATTNSTPAKLRALGFRNIINKYPNMKIIESQSGESARSTGQKVMENMIQTVDENITAVYSHADESSIGAIQALKAAGKKPGIDTVIVSIDGEKDALKAIISGEIGATIECSPFLGEKAFQVIDQHQMGVKIPVRIIQPGRIFTLENAQSYLNQTY